jgi:hypothetical protein
VSDKLEAFVATVGICVASYGIALGLGYAWINLVHYPPTVRQRKMFVYFALFLASLPIIGALCGIVGLWVLPSASSAALLSGALLLFVLWGIIVAKLVRKMSAPGRRFYLAGGADNRSR